MFRSSTVFGMGDSDPLSHIQSILDDQDPTGVEVDVSRDAGGDVASLRFNAGPSYTIPTLAQRGSTISANPPTSLSAERLSLSTASSDINDFFAGDDGGSLNEVTNNHTSLGPTKTSAPGLYWHRPFSTPSVHTVIHCGVWNISVSQLCDVIGQHRSLRHAEILSTECYSESINGVVHRFLILELHREGRKDIWLRLDRRSGRSVLQLLRNAGKAPAKDTAQLAVDKQDLVRSARLENRQVFEALPTLGELQCFLSIVCEELTVYKAWPENCYFYCSLIQEHLGVEGEGIFSKGKLPYPDLAQEIRDRVRERVRLFYHMPAPLTLTSLLAWFLEIGLPCELGDALSLARQWDLLRNTGSVRSRELADKLERALHPIGDTLLSKIRLPEAAAFFRLKVHLCQCLDENDIRLAVSLEHYRVCLQMYRRFDDACEAAVEAVVHARRLYERNQEQHVEYLVDVLREYGISLREAQRLDEACNTGAETVTLSRNAYAHDPERYCEALLVSLHCYKVSLVQTKQFGDACEATAECVTVCRHLYDRNREQYCGFLIMSLCDHSASLRAGMQFEDACKASAEAVAFSRQVYAHDAERYCKIMSVSLRHYQLSLRRVKRLNDECDAAAERVTIYRRIYERDQEQYCENLSYSFHEYGISLREAKRFSDACKAGAEAVALCRHLYARDAEQYCGALSLSLQQYGISLSRATQFHDACEATAEAVTLYHHLYERDREQYGEHLSYTLHEYELQLREAKRFDDA